MILAVLTPAAQIVSIDFGPAPEPDASSGAGSAAPAVPAALSAYAQAQTVASVVPASVVDPVVREVSLTPPAGARVSPRAMASAARAKVIRTGGQRLLSAPQEVTGYGAVGLTWQHGDVVPDDQIKVKARTRSSGGAWSRWTTMAYHDEHGPDPASAEGRRARPGTDELLVGRVGEVQVKVVTPASAPPDLRLAVIDPGVPLATKLEKPALDTAKPTGAQAQPAVATDVPDAPADVPGATQSTSAGDVRLAAASYTPRPVIYSRAQWGADERLRDKSSLRYHEVHAGFVHHTVNANNYQPADVPAILRGIYAYHTKSRGWSDVGYNFLVDKFGRIWEGRAGGIDRPVVGAHTLGYNDDSFAMSAIGNFDTAKPSAALVQAYGALFAWKLSLHGVSAASTRQYVTTKYFQAINGHRDAGSTACPGRYLYARIPDIRRLAAQAQVGFAGRQLERNLAGTPQPDVLVRRKSDKRAYVVPLQKTATGYSRGTPINTGIDMSQQNLLLNAGDWNRDGKPDMITRRSTTGVLYMRPGLGNGKFGPAVEIGRGFGPVKLLSAVGDVTGDGWPDLMGQPTGAGMRIYPGRGPAPIATYYPAYGRVTGGNQIAVGLWDGDGAPDSLVRQGRKLVLYPGNGPGGMTGARSLSLDLRGYDRVVGLSDMDLTGHPDLVLRKKGTGEAFLVPATATAFAAPVSLGKGWEVFDMMG
ncbi:FG-GAP-like repeat-containing protein [Nocardioides litoris]|uniref:FG-GAP-like repeat-containing protein n=1 Tax=Nocardioides litoris TaxID=1926648 RepID=UPI00111EFFAB|nr:FG-GAP-like repeat-containing protein [Nocardioides litoris]